MLIEDVCLVDCSESKIVTLEVDEKNIITSIRESSHKNSTQILLPLMVDLNVSTLNDSMNATDLQNLSSQALAEGIAAIGLRPFTHQTNSSTQISSIHAHLDGHKGAKVFPMFTVLKDEKHLADIAKLTHDGKSLPYIYSDMDSNLMRRVMQYAVMKKIAILCDLRDSSLNADAVMNEGEINAKMGLVGNSSLGELIQVGKVIEMASFFDVEVLIKGISTSAVLYKIQRAKSKGVKVKAEVALHHLVLDDSACMDYHTQAKIDPPLRSKSEVLLMQQALQEGCVDVLTSLHSPKSALEKETAFALSATGSANLENIISLYYTHLIHSKLIDIKTFVQLTMTTPASYIKYDIPEIKVGNTLKAVLLNTTHSETFSSTTSLYNKTKLQAKIQKIF